MMKRVVSGMFDGAAAFGSPAGAARVAASPPGTPARGENGSVGGGAAAGAGIAGAIAFGQFLPTLKRGLLHAQACEPVLKELTAAA